MLCLLTSTPVLMFATASFDHLSAAESSFISVLSSPTAAESWGKRYTFHVVPPLSAKEKIPLFFTLIFR